MLHCPLLLVLWTLSGGAAPAQDTGQVAPVRIGRAEINSLNEVFTHVESVTQATGVPVRRQQLFDMLMLAAKDLPLRGLDLDRPIAAEWYCAREDLPTDLDQIWPEKTVTVVAWGITVTPTELRGLLRNAGMQVPSDPSKPIVSPFGTEQLYVGLTDGIAYGATDPSFLKRLAPRKVMGKSRKGGPVITVDIDFPALFQAISHDELRKLILDGLDDPSLPDEPEVARRLLNSLLDFFAGFVEQTEVMRIAQSLQDEGLQHDLLLKARRDSSFSRQLGNLAPQSGDLRHHLPSPLIAGLTADIPNVPAWRRDFGPELFRELEKRLREQEAEILRLNPAQRESAQKKLRLFKDACSDLRTITEETKRIVVAGGLSPDAGGSSVIVAVAELEGSSNGARDLLDLLLRMYDFSAESGHTPELRLETAEDHKRFRVVRVHGLQLPREVISDDSEFEVLVAARGPRFLVLAGNDAHARLAESVDRMDSPREPQNEPRVTRPVNLRLWIDVGQFLRWVNQTFGAEHPEVGAALAMVGMMFQEPGQQLSVSATMNRDGLTVTQRLPKGAYALLGQTIGIFMRQMREYVRPQAEEPPTR